MIPDCLPSQILSQVRQIMCRRYPDAETADASCEGGDTNSNARIFEARVQAWKT